MRDKRDIQKRRVLAGAGALLFGLLASTPAQAAAGLTLFPQWGLLLILLVGFVVLVFPLNALIFKPLFRVLEERDERIAGARARAAQLESDAEELLGRYRTAIAEVREASERDRRAQLEVARGEQSELTDTARSEAEAVVSAGRVELESWLGDARATLRSDAQPLAQMAAERVLGRSLS